MDGTCDDVDPCVGGLDACGVCNGPGAIMTADVSTSQKATATATATSLMPSASAAVHARVTWTPTAFVTTWTIVWAPLTPAASATVRCDL